MKRVILLVLAAALLALSGGCGKKYDIPDLETNKAAFFNIWDRVLPIEKIQKDVLENRALEYPEELNLQTHPGLLTAADFTGPVFKLHDPEQPDVYRKTYVPCMTADKYLTVNLLPAGLVAETSDFESTLGDNYGAFVSEEKLAAIQDGDFPLVYALLECIGYADEGQTYYYRSGEPVTLYEQVWRVAYYSYPEGRLLAWETAPREYPEGDFLTTDNIYFDMNERRVKKGGVNKVEVSIQLLLGEQP